jgi:hypothetical protein
MALRAQTWSIDYMAAMLIFIVAMVLSIKLLTNLNENAGFDDTKREAQRLSEIFNSEGVPAQWTNETVIRPGLIDDDLLSASQVGALMNMSYNHTRRILNIKGDFYIEFINTTDQKTPVFINASCGYGSPDVETDIDTIQAGISACTGYPCDGLNTACTGTYSSCTGAGQTCLGSWGQCAGIPLDCWQLEDLGFGCLPQYGCYIDGETGMCTGGQPACNTYITKSTCRVHPGCGWLDCTNFSSSQSACTQPPRNTTCTFITCINYTTNAPSCTALGCTWANCTTASPPDETSCEVQYGGSQCIWKNCSDFTGNPTQCSTFGCSVTYCSAIVDPGTCSLNPGCTWVPGAGGFTGGNCTTNTNTIGTGADQLIRIDRLVRYQMPTATGDTVEDLLTMRLYVWD